MDPVTLLIWLLIGAVAGWLAGQIYALYPILYFVFLQFLAFHAAHVWIDLY